MGSPSLLAAQSEPLLKRHNASALMIAALCIGAAVTDGGSTQASGASGVLNFDIDTTAIPLAFVSNDMHTLAAQTDADSDAGAGLVWGATSGKEVKFMVVLETGTANDTPAIFAKFGEVADSGTSIAPTIEEMKTALGHDNVSVLSIVTIERTADTTLSFSAWDGARIAPAIANAATVSLAETEVEFRTVVG